MDRRIRIVAVVLVVLFGLLFIQLNNLQVRQAGALRTSPLTPPSGANPWDETRGALVTSDGVELAYTTKTAQGYLRHYPDGPLYAAVTGYYDPTAFAVPLGLEAAYNNDLLVHTSDARTLHGVLTERTGTDTIETTISSKVQAAAAQALGHFVGAVVAVVPSTGAVLAMYSNPTYDPNKLATLDTKSASAYYAKLQAAGGASPLVNGTTRQRNAPGSTFKVITTATLFDTHATALIDKVWPYESSTPLPDTNAIFHNYDSESCGGPLAVILATSCDTAYAEIGIGLGATALAKEAAAFGFGTVPPIDLPAHEVVPAVFPSTRTLADNKPLTAYSAIGQFDVAETVLQDALVAAAIANHGTIMVPHLMANVIDDEGHLVDTYAPRVWRTATSPATADEVRTLMLGVATSGTAAGVFPSNLDVAAKTGTAETGTAECSADWMIATAPAGATQTPKVAVAVFVPYQAGVGCSETGAEVAGPIAAKVIEAALQEEK